MGDLNVGIEKLWAAPGALVLSMADLARARGDDPAWVRSLMVDERSVLAPWEDPVTLAVSAADPMLSDGDRAAVKLLIVATESALDLEKPLSSWLHHFLGLGSDCRNLEVKHACYGGVAAMQLALSWLAAHPDPAAKALVVATDHSLLALGERHEYVMGSGAAAALLSRTPDLLAVDWQDSGVYANEVTDVIRPTGQIETGNSETSLFSYMEALNGAFDAYEGRNGPTDVGAFAACVYHAPFGGITARAHRMLLGRSRDLAPADAQRHFEAHSLPALTHHRRTSGAYSASVYWSLLGLCEHHPSLVEGDRIGIYSYGSGSCAEYLTARVGPRARELARAAGLGAQLDARQGVTVAQYERLERARQAMVGQRHWRPDAALAPGGVAGSGGGGGRRLALVEIADFVRRYQWM